MLWMRTLLTLVAVVVLGPAVARQAAAQSSGAQVVVRATGSDGRPIVDLKQSEITLRIDGRQREIASLELVQPAEGAPASAAPAAPVSSLPAPYATNAAAGAGPAGGREFMILIDDEGIGSGREPAVRAMISKLVAALKPSDRIGLVALKHGGLSIAPTAQHAALLAALPKVVTTGAQNETLGNLACRTTLLFGTLAGLFRGAPAERTLVLISPGVSPVLTDTMRASARDSSESNLCQIRTQDYEELGRAAVTSAAEMFVVYYAEGMANAANVSQGHSGLENVAGSTDAESLRLVGDGDTAAARIAQSAGTYYVATLNEGAPTAGARRVEVRVPRNGVRVTGRPLGGPAAAAGKAGAPKDMIRVATVYRDVAVRAAGFVSRQPGSNDLKVLALFEPEEAGVKFNAAVIGLFDQKGTLKAQWTAQAGELERSPVLAALTAAPGRYRMRVAASDGSGKGGTTDYELTVQLPDAAPLKTSDMLLGVSQGGFSPKLAFTSNDASAIGFLELYGVAKEAKVEVTFEIVKGDEAMGSGPGTIGPGAGEDARIAYGGFGIATLEPGDYTMRATVNVDGKRASVLTRTLRKLK